MLRKKSIMKEWMISYTLILLIPLITIFINYGYNARVIRKEIIQAHELILYNLRDNIDRLMDEEREMFWSFYSNERFGNCVWPSFGCNRMGCKHKNSNVLFLTSKKKRLSHAK